MAMHNLVAAIARLPPNPGVFSGVTKLACKLPHFQSLIGGTSYIHAGAPTRLPATATRLQATASGLHVDSPATVVLDQASKPEDDAFEPCSGIQTKAKGNKGFRSASRWCLKQALGL